MAETCLRKNAHAPYSTVRIYGLGYVGLPLVFAFVNRGFRILGFDTDEAKVGALRKGRSYIKHISDSVVMDVNQTGRFEPTTDLSRAVEADALVLCVPTPLTRQREPDMSYVVSTVESIAPYLRS